MTDRATITDCITYQTITLAEARELALRILADAEAEREMVAVEEVWDFLDIERGNFTQEQS